MAKKVFAKAKKQQVMKKTPNPGTKKPPGSGTGTVNTVKDAPCQITVTLGKTCKNGVCE